MTLYSILMELGDDIYYAYEYRSNGLVCFDSTPRVSTAKLWKTNAGALKALNKLKNEQKYFVDKYRSISVSPVEEADVQYDAFIHTELKISRSLDHLARQKNTDIRSNFNYQLALLLTQLYASSFVYLFETKDLTQEPSVVEVTGINGMELLIDTRRFERIKGHEVGQPGRILPTDHSIYTYFKLHQQITEINWADQDIETLAAVVEVLNL